MNRSLLRSFKRVAGVFGILFLCASVRQAWAMGEVISVTKENQAKLGIRFTLVADQVDSEAILVRMEIPRAGKLKAIRSISMRIGSGRPLVSAPLQTSAGKGGSLVVNFQINPRFADQCTVDLVTPHDPPLESSYLVYAVEIKGYVTVRK